MTTTGPGNTRESSRDRKGGNAGLGGERGDKSENGVWRRRIREEKSGECFLRHCPVERGGSVCMPRLEDDIVTSIDLVPQNYARYAKGKHSGNKDDKHDNIALGFHRNTSFSMFKPFPQQPVCAS